MRFIDSEADHKVNLLMLQPNQAAHNKLCNRPIRNVLVFSCLNMLVSIWIWKTLERKRETVVFFCSASYQSLLLARPWCVWKNTLQFLLLAKWREIRFGPCFNTPRQNIEKKKKKRKHCFWWQPFITTITRHSFACLFFMEIFCLFIIYLLFK